jgi:hypothetical protein
MKSILHSSYSNVSIFLACGFELTLEAMQLSAKGLHACCYASFGILTCPSISWRSYMWDSTGEFIELNQIKSWNFITIDDDDSEGRSVTKATWYLFISLLRACVVVAI